MNNKTKNILIGIVLFAIFVLHEYARVAYPDTNSIRYMLKLFIGVVPICIVHYSCSGVKTMWQKAVILGIIMYCVADVAMTYSMGIGMFLFAVAHVCILTGLISVKKPSKAMTIVWIICSVIVVIIFFTVGPLVGFDNGFLAFASIYFLLVVAVTVESFCVSRGIFSGAVLFLVSDIFIIYNIIYGETVVRHFFSLGIYYLAVFVLAVYVKQMSEKMRQEE